MLYLFYFALLFLNLIFALKKKHSKIIFRISFLFIWLLIAGNTNNPDMLSYEYIYYTDNSNIEPAFKLLIDFFRSFGLEYNFFVASISVICLLLIFSSFKKYTKNLNFVIFLYMIYPFILDVIQFRNFICVSILVFSLQFLLKNDLQNKVIFAILIILAGLFHNLYFLYLVLLLINLQNKNLLIKLIIALTLVFSIIIFLNGNKIPFLYQILPISVEKFDSYFTARLRFGFIVIWFFNLSYIYLLGYSKKQVIKNTNSYNFDVTKKYINLVFWINIVTIVFFPLYMVNINFYRLFRNISLINYSVYAITVDKIMENRGKGYSLLKYVFIIILGILILFYYDVGSNFDYIFKPIMENNVILK